MSLLAAGNKRALVVRAVVDAFEAFQMGVQVVAGSGLGGCERTRGGGGGRGGGGRGKDWRKGRGATWGVGPALALCAHQTVVHVFVAIYLFVRDG